MGSTRLLDGILVGGDQAMVHLGDEVWTRREVEAMAPELAIEPGQGVAVQLPDGPQLVATLLAVWRAGGVYVPLNPRAGSHDVERVLAEVDPAVVVTEAGVEARPSDRHHDPGVALVSFTSGTTGRPKPVPLRHSEVRDLMEGVLQKMGWQGPADDPMPNLVPVSLSLWAGLYNLLFAFRVGAPVVLLPRFDTREFAELVRRFGIRSTVLPPAAMTMLADDEAVADLAPLRFVRSITAPLSPLQARRFRDRFGISVLNSYGQTELGGEIVGWNAADAREHGEDKLGSVGRPHEGVEVCADPESGELLVHTAAMAEGDWHHTGDIGRIDEDGFVWIEGRVSDMVNRGGLKVFPAEVEEVLRLDPAVTDVAVAGVADDRLGEVPVAFVVGPVDPARLEALCREHLSPYKVPVRFEPVDALPRNEVGKVLLHQLVAENRF
jgi:acyl-CoA synthetase (AMP-forming)/AMP-acid ligase II